MFDKKKISLNHARSNKVKDIKANKFFFTLSTMLLERASSKIKIIKENKILELASRNNSLYEILKANGLNSNFYQSTLSKNVILPNKKRVIASLNDQVFINDFFDICFCILSVNSSKNVPELFHIVYNILKPKGIFLAVLPSSQSFLEFRNFFLNFFQPAKNFSFNPALDIQTLGNIGSSAGFNNVIVDKEEFKFAIERPEEIWRFIRSLGESNYLKERRRFMIRKSSYKKFYLKYNKMIMQKKLKNNNFALNFFIGHK